jgi:hypothetical protein
VGVSDRGHLTQEECLTQLQRGREALLADVDTFQRVCEWLEGGVYYRRRTINKRITSYGLKHIAERAIDAYVANGTCIAAVIASHFDYQLIPGSPNVWFNMSTLWVRAEEQRAERYRKVPA